jgi:hypothetical protein
MIENTTTQAAEVIEHHGYKIRLAQAGLEWIAAVALPGQRPTLIVASERETAITKAKDWIELRRASDGMSE